MGVAEKMIRAQADTVWFEWCEVPDDRDGYRRFYMDLLDGRWGLLHCGDGTCIISAPSSDAEGWAHYDLLSLDTQVGPVDAAKIIVKVMRTSQRAFSRGHLQRGVEIRTALGLNQ